MGKAYYSEGNPTGPVFDFLILPPLYYFFLHKKNQVHSHLSVFCDCKWCLVVFLGIYDYRLLEGGISENVQAESDIVHGKLSKTEKLYCPPVSSGSRILRLREKG